MDPDMENTDKLMENERQRKEIEEKIQGLEDLFSESGVLSYDPECVRKRSNWAQSSNIYKFDDEAFDPQMFLKDMPHSSPKLAVLMQKIEELDRHDTKVHGKKYKHFIFSDLKSSAYGAKMLASALLAKGFKMGDRAERKQKGGD